MTKFLLFFLLYSIPMSPCWSGESQPLSLSKSNSLNFLVEKCGYDLGKFVGSEEKSIEIYHSNSGEFLYDIGVNLNITFPNRVVGAVFSTFCKYSPKAYGLKWPSMYWENEGSMKEAVASGRLSNPKEIISEEDSGGRYGRNVSWTKPFVGVNFKGKISYVNSQFGDGQKTNSPDFFMICPDDSQLTCMSLEFPEKIRLSPKERRLIMIRLRDIRYIPKQ